MDKFPLILSDNNPVPCAVVGTKEQYQNAVDAFLTCPIGDEQGKPHLSDQLAVQMLKFPAVDICREYGKPGWRDAKLIHFSHAACGEQKRSDAMKEWTMIDGARFPESEAIKEPKSTIMDEIRERLEWVRDNSRGITRHHVHRELKKLGLLPKK